ncbi:MAG: hypothetical protein Q6364_11435 [Candidatus Hermodarchaeota archaeon]|nr:hypothetical protein [Candidatus Hermodarchaeota archaeon]
MEQEEQAIQDTLKSTRKLLIAFIGLSVFAFLLVFIAVELFLNTAFVLLVFGVNGPWPPELFPTFTLTQFHDIGIVLASVGLVLLYLPITLTLVIVEQSETRPTRIRSRVIHLFSHSDFFKIVGFLGLFLAAGGIWFCMHQAFLFQGEWLKGTLLFNNYIFLSLEISPMILHLFGNLLVLGGLGTIVLISSVKLILGLLAQMGRLR